VLPQRKHATLDVRVVEDGAGRTLAILPLFTEWLAGPMTWITQFLGHRMSYHNDMLLLEPANPELADAVVQLLLDDIGASTILHLRELVEDSLVTQALLACGAAEPQVPRVSLPAPLALAAPGKRLGRLGRKSKHNHLHQLQRHFTVEIRSFLGSDFPSAFDELMRLHRKRFASQHRATQLVGADLRFLRRATAASSPPFVVTQLLADGVAIAAELEAYDRGRCFAVQKGFDPAFARFSPARILFAEILRRSFEELGCHLMDLGVGFEEYKYEGSPTVGMNYRCCYGGKSNYAKSVSVLYRVALRALVHWQARRTGKSGGLDVKLNDW